MKAYIKNLVRVGVLATALIGSYFIGSNNGSNNGYESGKQNTIKKLKSVSDIVIENCEHDIDVYRTFKWLSDKSELKRFEDLTKRALDKRNTVKDLVSTVKNENISIN